MGILDRLKAGYSAFKSLPFASGNGSSHWDSLAFWNPYSRTNINYAAEVGDLGGSSLIMAAVNWMGTVLPEAPIQVKKRKSPKVWEPLPDHPLVALINRPNPYYSGRLLWKSFAYSWIVSGNVYFLKKRNQRGVVIELWYEPHDNVRIVLTQDGSELFSHYEFWRNNRWNRIEKEDVVHFRYGSDQKCPWYGLSPVASVLREIFTDNERARYAALILKNGGVVPYLLSLDPKASAVGINKAELKEEWMARTRGDNVGKPIVLDSPIRVDKLGLSPANMLVDEASKIPEERIAAVIGIPAIVLGFGAGLARSTFANYAEAREAAYESFVIPNQGIIADELQVQLLPEFGDSGGLQVGHDLSMVRVLQDDRDTLFTRECLAYEKGVKKRGESRSALGLDTDESDNVYFVLPQKEVEDPIEPPAFVDMPVPDGKPLLRNGKDKVESLR